MSDRPGLREFLRLYDGERARHAVYSEQQLGGVIRPAPRPAPRLGPQYRLAGAQPGPD